MSSKKDIETAQAILDEARQIDSIFDAFLLRELIIAALEAVRKEANES